MPQLHARHIAIVTVMAIVTVLVLIGDAVDTVHTVQRWLGW